MRHSTHPMLEAYANLQAICQFQLKPQLNELQLPALSAEDKKAWQRKLQPVTTLCPLGVSPLGEATNDWRQFFASPQVHLCLYQLQGQLGQQNKLDWQVLWSLWFETSI